MIAKSKGIKRAAPQRARMPWTEPREQFPVAILSRRDKAILDGQPAFGSIVRSQMLEPLEGLKAVVAKRDFNVSTGKTLYQLAVHLKHNGRGLRFYRKEWREGTYDKFVTLSSIYFNREMLSGGEAYGYTTFHGESSFFPMPIDNANLPGWFVLEYNEKTDPVPPEEIVSPPPSIGTEVPVDTKTYRLKAYPFYDAPNPDGYVTRLLRERGVLPDIVDNNNNNNGENGDSSSNDGSEHHKN
jgi:hypothetical protein